MLHASLFRAESGQRRVGSPPPASDWSGSGAGSRRNSAAADRPGLTPGDPSRPAPPAGGGGARWIELGYGGIEDADRVLGSDVVVESLEEESRLRSVGTGDVGRGWHSALKEHWPNQGTHGIWNCDESSHGLTKRSTTTALTCGSRVLADELHLVTGSFGYSGRYIATRLLADGCRVRTVTNSPGRGNALAARVDVRPIAFDQPNALADSLRGAAVLYNTYWVRFNHRSFTHSDAVANTLVLFDAARRAGVRRVVHVSITKPSEDSPLEYFRGKARLERALTKSGMPHTILRPAVLFGGTDILVNNIAWALRHLPVFGIFGTGGYRLQPIHVEDFAALAVAEGREGPNHIVDATGPETFTYRELVERLAGIIGCRRPIVSVPPTLGFLAVSILGLFVRDIVLTRDEIAGLMAGMLATDSPPAGTTRLTDWARAHANRLGRRYASELARRRA